MLKNKSTALRLDIIGLLLAGLINTFLAMFDAGVIFAPGTPTGQPDVWLRAQWIVENGLRWQGGWLFWFPVTLSFAWSYYALGRHLTGSRAWFPLALGVALVAAAVDLVGVLINMTVLPHLAQAAISDSSGSTIIVFEAMEKLTNALTNISAFGLYSVAGALLIPAAFATKAYPRWLAWFGVVEWGIALFATVLLMISPVIATVPLLISFVLYAPWVWGSAYWLYKK